MCAGDDDPPRIRLVALGALAENPHRVGKQLSEPLHPLYSARRGEYRVIYRIEDRLVLIEIVSITHRRDAYRAH